MVVVSHSVTSKHAIFKSIADVQLIPVKLTASELGKITGNFKNAKWLRVSYIVKVFITIMPSSAEIDN